MKLHFHERIFLESSGARSGGDIAKQEKLNLVPGRGGVECLSRYPGCQPNKSVSVDVYNKFECSTHFNTRQEKPRGVWNKTYS